MEMGVSSDKKYGMDDLPIEVAMAKSKAAESVEGGSVVSDARQWEGNYVSPNNTEVTRMVVSLHDSDSSSPNLH